MIDDMPPSLLRSLEKLSLSKKEWTSVLTLATKWKFRRVRKMAILALECSIQGSRCLTSLEKICIGRILFIPSWVIDGFVGLVQAKTITDEEALNIDNDKWSRTTVTACKLFRIRELRITGNLSCARKKVEEIFENELAYLRSKEIIFDINKWGPLAPTAEKPRWQRRRSCQWEDKALCLRSRSCVSALPSYFVVSFTYIQSAMTRTLGYSFVMPVPTGIFRMQAKAIVNSQCREPEPILLASSTKSTKRCLKFTEVGRSLHSGFAPWAAAAVNRQCPASDNLRNTLMT